MKTMIRSIGCSMGVVLIVALAPVSRTTINAASSVTAKYQFENAVLNKAKIGKTYKGYSGKGYVAFPKNKSNAKATLKVNSDSSGKKTLTLRYANGNKKAAKLVLYANGKKVKGMTLASTKKWTSWKNINVSAKLKKGMNSLIVKNPTKRAFNIDRVSFKVSQNGLVLNLETQYQKIEGFGSFGTQRFLFGADSGTTGYLPEVQYPDINIDVGNDYNSGRWNKINWCDDTFLNHVYDDLGQNIVRINLSPEFGTFDNSRTGLNKYNVRGTFGVEVGVIKKMKDKCPQLKVIATPWSPPAWMKTNNSTVNLDSKGDLIGGVEGQLKTDSYSAYAEYLSDYCKLFKQEMGFDLYAVSIQNEPDFNEPYESCVMKPKVYAQIIKAVGKKFQADGLKVKIFGPEDIIADVGVERVANYMYSMDDAKSIQYLDILAVHGYGSNGTDAGSPAAGAWKRTKELAKEYKKQVWMTETSGYENTWNGAMQVAEDMYVALKYGQINGWVWWQINDFPSSPTMPLMINGLPISRFHTSQNYYKYIRPGAVQVNCISKYKDVLSTAFIDKGNRTITIVMVNNSKDSPRNIGIGINGTLIPKKYKAYRTSETENFIDLGDVSSATVTLPKSSVTTLMGTY